MVLKGRGAVRPQAEAGRRRRVGTRTVHSGSRS